MHAATGRAVRARAAAAEMAEAQRARLPLLIPVLVGLGVWLWVAAPVRPPTWTIAAGAALALAALLRARASGPVRGLAAGLLLVAAGAGAADLRGRLVAAPVLSAPVQAAVSGRAIALSRSRTDQPRVTLTEVTIHGVPASATPARVRVTLVRGVFERPVRVGQRVQVWARLSPPGAPVEPGGFDFRRAAWFDRLGAVGYALGPVTLSAAAAAEGIGPATGPGPLIGRWRGEIAEALVDRIPGEAGAFAAAILVGSRAEVPEEALQALRDSNLAHLLAISGLHMGLLAAIVFGTARLILAALPGVAERISTRKAAALAALLAGAGYLAFSGGAVATQRAFVMAAAALLAIMIDRPAISLRALAAAATAILLLRPESLVSVGFQMSFAATAGLVAVYEALPTRGPGPRGALRRARDWALGLALASAVAGIATAPYAAAAFDRLVAWGLPANMLAVPLMGMVVMPAGAAAAALAPLGLEGPALWVMGQGIEGILAVARWAAALPGAVRTVPAAPPGALALVTLGGLALTILRGPPRALGALPVAAGLALWLAGAARPEVLVAEGAAAVGALAPEGRAVDRARGQGYAIETWLRRDGDGATQEEAAARPGLVRDGPVTRARLSNGWEVAVLRGRGAEAALPAVCAPRTLVISPAFRAAPEGGCRILDAAALERLGALAIDPEGAGVRVRGARAGDGGRAWTGRAWTGRARPAD